MTQLTLDQVHSTPQALLSLEDISKLPEIFPNPTLLHLTGRKKQPLFVSVLLHGNEDTGIYAIQKILRKYEEQPLPRSLIIFFGNIAAAKYKQRRLENQPDYNRVWPGSDLPTSAESALMQKVTDIVAAAKPFASLDIHNNTGKNPHYACINLLENRFFHMATLFSRTVVFFETPKGVQSAAMAKYCPAVTIECGQPHLPHGITHATEFLNSLLHIHEIPDHPIHEQDINIFHTVARIKIPTDSSFSFTDKKADIYLQPDIENYNFAELDAGFEFGKCNGHQPVLPEAWNDNNENKSAEFFYLEQQTLRLRKPLMPAMITLNKDIIRQDCLCYLMERLPLPK